MRQAQLPLFEVDVHFSDARAMAIKDEANELPCRGNTCVDMHGEPMRHNRVFLVSTGRTRRRSHSWHKPLSQTKLDEQWRGWGALVGCEHNPEIKADLVKGVLRLQELRLAHDEIVHVNKAEEAALRGSTSPGR